MKRDFFNNIQAEPEDDITALWGEAYGDGDGVGSDLEAEEDSFEDTDHLGGWNCTVRDRVGNDMTLRGFATREALVAYLAAHKIEVIS